jgi:uncharacterized protein
MKNIIFVLGIFFMTCIENLCAQETTENAFPPVILPNTEVRLLPSKNVNKDYKLYISLPKSYAEIQKSFDVVYLLDADYAFAIARNVVEHLSDRNNLPELILVGIAYDGPLQYQKNRTRDYTPTNSTVGYSEEIQVYSGGADNFKAFIQDELQPFIEENYRTTQIKSMVGHSYGGLFGTWVIFTEPDLFDNYILVSPSLWFDDHLMFKIEEKFSRTNKSLPIRLFYTVGSRKVNNRANMVNDLQEFTTQVKSRNYQSLQIQTIVLDEETHNSIFPAGLSKGIRFIY